MATITKNLGEDEEFVVPSPMAMTEAEYELWDDELWTGEWIDGTVEYFLPVTSRICEIRMQLMMLLVGFATQHELGEIRGPNYPLRIPEPRRRRLPDLMFVSSVRRNILKERYCDGPPDLALEIVAPESTSRDYRVKYQEYEAFGIREYWIVDPQNEIVEAAALDDQGVYQPRPVVDSAIHSIVLPGWYLKPGWLWSNPPRKPLDVLRELKVIQ